MFKRILSLVLVAVLLVGATMAFTSCQSEKKDIKAALDSLRTESGYLFDDNGGNPAFTDPNGNGGNAGGTVTAKDIMAIKDPIERQSKIVQNMHLFKKG